VRDALVETTIGKDVLLMAPVHKPALLRRVFDLACRYSGQVLSYTKMLGTLQDAGNTTTLAHYLDLLAGAGMVCGLQKVAGRAAVRQRASSPKLQVFNTAFMGALAVHDGDGFARVRADPALWGRLVQGAVGAQLLAWRPAGAHGSGTLTYWRQGAREVDLVVRRGDETWAMEVKSGRARDSLPGLDAFAAACPGVRPLVVGTGGMALQRWFEAPFFEG
jgi:predicted AAA+ superfamily ATPase